MTVSLRRGALGGLAAAAIAAVLVVRAGPAAVARLLSGVAWPFALAALAAAALFVTLRGLRWALILRPVPAGLREAAALQGVGHAASSVLPLKAGDVLRLAWMSRRTGAGLPTVAGSIAVERALDVLGLALLATLGLGLLAATDAVALPGWLGPLLAVAWAVPLLGAAILVALAAWLRRRPARNPLTRALSEAAAALPALLRDRRRGTSVLSLSLAVSLAQVALQSLLVLAVVPSAPAVAVAALAPAFTLSFGIPLTPAHVGTYEVAFVAVFGLAAPAPLLAAALATHALAIASAIAVGAAAWCILPRRAPPPAAPGAAAPVHVEDAA